MENLDFIASVSAIIGGIDALMNILKIIYNRFRSKKKHTTVLKFPKTNNFFTHKRY